MTRCRFPFAWPLALAAATLVSVPDTSRATLTFNLNTTFSGDTPSGVPVATFMDQGGGTVRLTMDLTALNPNEFVDGGQGWFFNVADDFVSTLSFSQVSMTNPSFTGFTVSQGLNAFQADGDGNFDIKIDFPSAPPAARFSGGNVLVVDITSSLAGLTENAFNFTSTPGGGNGTFYTAAHVQGIGSNAQGSGWVGDGDGGGGPTNPVPEPSTLALALTALVPLGVVGLRRLRCRPVVTSA